jgi:type VI protein secretion system component Hcp
MAAYIKFDQVDGPCQIKDHEKWIVLESWGWDCERQVSAGNQIGLASGVAKFGIVSFKAPIGSATVTMFQMMCQGKHFSSVLIHCTKNTGKDDPEIWLKLKLEHVMVTKITQSVDEDENGDEVEIAFSQCEMKVKDQEADGSLSTKEVIFNYDVTTNSVGAGKG